MAFISLFFAHIETVSFLIICPLLLYDAVCVCIPGRWQRARVALWQTGSEEERQHGGSSENHHIWNQRLFQAWVILATILVKVRVCFRHSISVHTKPLF